MKHIKLFENWAEELKVPEYLDPKKKIIKFNNEISYTKYSKKIQDQLGEEYCDLGASENNLFLNFEHFYELEDVWSEEGYDELWISQSFCKYKLKDLEELPVVDTRLYIYDTNIKTLKGINISKIDILEIGKSKLENLKYCPIANEYSFNDNPLLSYFGIGGLPLYGIKTPQLMYSKGSLCGQYCYPDKPDLNEITNIEYHAEAFCNFKNNIENTEYSNGIQFNPWHQIYHDPNDVENYEFLFVTFWKESENFREKAPTMIANLDMSGITRGKESLW